MMILLVDEVPCLFRYSPFAHTISALLSHVVLHTEYNFLGGIHIKVPQNITIQIP